MADLPTVITASGVQPRSPAAILARLIALVGVTNPGYTANLPGSLIEDISSTDVASISLIDQAKVDLINSLTPFGANAFLCLQLGNIYGVPQGLGSNTQVDVVFTGSPGYVIAKGFTVGDGSFQYICQDPVVIGSGGVSLPVTAVATTQGSWAVPANTVTNLVTAVPLVSGIAITLSVTNPTAGLPGLDAQTLTDYRSQVLQAGLAASTGMSRYLKTLLQNVPGVQANLVRAVQQTGGGWEMIVGGGDQYQIANAIFESLFDISTLVGSTMNITNITRANPGVVTTLLNHGLANGTLATLTGVVGMTQVNGTAFTITVIDQKDFSIGVNTTGYGAYVSGGVVTPNPRNVSVTIYDYPDTYNIPIVRPPQQSVSISLLWGTSSVNPVSSAAMAQLGAPALAAYVNGIAAGQPMNLFELQAVFQEATSGILPTPLLTRMAFTISINGIGVVPQAGTGIIQGDPESYFYASPTSVLVLPG